MTIKLYDSPNSGNCHKVRMLLSFLGLDYSLIPVNLPKGEQKAEAFLAINPLGKIPVLDDDGVVIRDSHAILVYLARKYDSGNQWLPIDATALAEVTQWLAFATNDVWIGPALARAIVQFGRPLTLEHHQAFARYAMAILEGRLAEHNWLALDRPTLGDIACYPYAGLAGEGEIALADYPACRAWFKRIELLDGYVGMEGLSG
jgi:glutathione S-transferase